MATLNYLFLLQDIPGCCFAQELAAGSNTSQGTPKLFRFLLFQHAVSQLRPPMGVVKRKMQKFSSITDSEALPSFPRSLCVPTTQDRCYSCVSFTPNPIKQHMEHGENKLLYFLGRRGGIIV